MNKLIESTSNKHRICQHFQNDMLGCNAVSWAPSNTIGACNEDGTVVKRLATGNHRVFCSNFCFYEFSYCFSYHSILSLVSCFAVLFLKKI